MTQQSNIFTDVLLAAIVIRQNKDKELRKTLKQTRTAEELKTALVPVYLDVARKGNKYV